MRAFLLVLAVLAAAAPASASTHLVSRAGDGAFPDAPSFHPALSQDRKAASLLAYDSAATNIAGLDTNGVSDVFVVRRAKPFKSGAKKATDWRPGATTLASRGMGGQAADGPSFLPDLDGDLRHGAHCVAFLSDATNLVPGDTNGKTDAFVTDLRNGQITRVSVNSAGEQSDGAAYDVQVDGGCDRVAFSSDASNLAFTQDKLVPAQLTINSPLTGSQRLRCRKRLKGHRAQQKKLCKTKKIKVANPRGSAVTSAPPAGTKQVYVRILGGQPDDAGLLGLTFLASASNSGEAGNGNSFDAAFGDLGDSCPKNCGTTSGDAVAFSSDATNLAGTDGNGLPDVYEHTFRIPTQHFADRRAHLPAYMKPATQLISASSSGQAGNGPSDQPAVNDSGRFVGFRTAATDLVSGDSNNVTDVLLADTAKGKPQLKRVSFSSQGNQQGNGASANPVVTRPGSPVLFESDADNLSVNPTVDRNCAGDVLFWNASNRRLATESLDSAGGISGNPPNPPGDPCPAPADRVPPATNPAASYFANYAAFEDANPLLDLASTGRPGAGEPRLHQVYVHFVGP